MYVFLRIYCYVNNKAVLKPRNQKWIRLNTSSLVATFCYNICSHLNVQLANNDRFTRAQVQRFVSVVLRVC